MRRLDPSMPPDIAARILSEEHGDLAAMWRLNLLSEREFNAGNFAGASTLLHAGVYLFDRETYAKEPWPTGKIKLPAPERLRCAHGGRKNGR